MSHTVSITISDQQYELARRRAFVEDLRWRHIWNALINAYIAGDITVTQQGRYSVHPPTSATPVVHVRKDADLVELEPDWSINDPRPQVGDKSTQQTRPHHGWGTSALLQHLKETTGRKIPKQYLRRLLNLLEIPKADNGRWYFDGINDPLVSVVIEAVVGGVYDEMIRVGLNEMIQRAKPKEPDVTFHHLTHEENKRRRYAARLRQLED